MITINKRVGIALMVFSSFVSCNFQPSEFDMVKFRDVESGNLDSAKIVPPEARNKIELGKTIYPIRKTYLGGLITSVIFDGKDHQNDPEIKSKYFNLVEEEKLSAVALQKK